MNTRAYLSQAKNIDNAIKNLLEYARQCRDDATSITPKLSDMKVQSSHAQDKMATSVAKALDYEKDAREKAEALLEIRHKIVYQIDGLRQKNIKHANDYYNILMGYYVFDKNTSAIARDIHFEPRYVRILHNRALVAFENMYGEEYLKD